MDRRLFPLTFALAGALVLGCQRGSESTSSSQRPATDPTTVAGSEAKQHQAPTDHLVSARRSFQVGNFETAAEEAYKALLQDPSRADATLLVSEIEAARGNHELAAELAGSIDSESRLRERAIEIQAQQLVKLNRVSSAADSLLAGLESMPEKHAWQHEAWRLLNQVGRREEASVVALTLCRSGLATEHELLSLISRSRSFPTPEMLQEKGEDLTDDASRWFASGLGKARWYFSMNDHRRALEELAGRYESGFADAASEALYGRLLAETQQWTEFQRWQIQSSEKTKRLADYWAAMGSFFIDNRRHEAAAKSFMEVIRRDPTDHLSAQRLSKALFSLGRSEDGEQFRLLGIEIAQTELAAQALYASPANIEARRTLTRSLLELQRPFETLAWTRSALPANAAGPRNEITQKILNLSRDKRALVMAAESALLDLDPEDFDLEPAMQELFADASEAIAPSAVPASEITATPRLVNRADQMDLKFQWYKDVEIDLDTIPIHESLGGGIAVLDYDLDGWPDIYLAQGSGDPPTDKCTRSSQMFHHQVDRFVDITSAAQLEDYHYSSGITSGDVNQDGFPDLYLGSLGHNRLLINNGDGTFREATSQLGDMPDRFTTSIGIADISSDGLPDLFESNYIEMEGGFDLPREGPDGHMVSPSPLSHYADSDRWFENLGDGRFLMHEIDRTIAKPGTSLGLVITDFDSDGKNEVFVGNDVRPNHFLVQSDSEPLVNLADFKGLANGFEGAANGCMGIATGDFNRDGRLDLQIANYMFEAANLYLQTSSGDFTDSAVRYGLADVTRPYVGFGTKAVDIDRNGFLDFIVTNGHIFDLRHAGEPYQMPPQLLMSDGRSLQLADVQDESGYWSGKYLGRSIALIDYDRDGAMDYLVGHLDQPLALLHDETHSGGGWLQLELAGTLSERDAIGAKVVLTIGGSQYTQWVTAGDGYFCNDEPIVAFGFSESEPLGRVDVHWPSGLQQTFSRVVCGKRYLMIEGDPRIHLRQ